VNKVLIFGYHIETDTSISIEAEFEGVPSQNDGSSPSYPTDTAFPQRCADALYAERKPCFFDRLWVIGTEKQGLTTIGDYSEGKHFTVPDCGEGVEESEAKSAAEADDSDSLDALFRRIDDELKDEPVQSSKEPVTRTKEYYVNVLWSCTTVVEAEDEADAEALAAEEAWDEESLPWDWGSRYALTTEIYEGYAE
jgi:hypothetical protein